MVSPNSYGLGIDSFGNVWNSQWTSNQIRKFNPAGGLFAGFPKGTGGASNDRGVTVTSDDHVWVANSGGNNVSRLDNNGNFLAAITTGPASTFGPTGVAVDANGNVWATHYTSQRAYRINPTIGAFGAVDLSTPVLGGNLYNYSDMTGSTLTGAPDNGTWTIIHDCGVVDFEWGTVTWTPEEPGDSSITVTAASSNDGVNFGPVEIVSNGVDLTVANGRFLKVVVSFTRATNIDSDGNGVNDSPILFDLTIQCCVEGAEVCDVDDDDIDVVPPPGFGPADVVGGRITKLDGVDVDIPAVGIDDDCDCDDDDNGDGDESPCVELEFGDLPFDLDEAIEVCVELDLVDGSVTCETCFIGGDDDDDDDD